MRENIIHWKDYGETPLSFHIERLAEPSRPTRHVWFSSLKDIKNIKKILTFRILIIIFY